MTFINNSAFSQALIYRRVFTFGIQSWLTYLICCQNIEQSIRVIVAKTQNSLLELLKKTQIQDCSSLLFSFQEHKTLPFEGKDKLSHPASPPRMESQNTTSRLTLPDEENMLSESCTQTDSLSLPLTVDLGTQTDQSDSSDHHENSTESLVIDATDSVSVSARENVSGFRIFFFFFPRTLILKYVHIYLDL